LISFMSEGEGAVSKKLFSVGLELFIIRRQGREAVERG